MAGATEVLGVAASEADLAAVIAGATVAAEVDLAVLGAECHPADLVGVDSAVVASHRAECPRVVLAVEDLVAALAAVTEVAALDQ